MQALATTIIGLLAAYIAYLSAKTARNKLKYDMFEKRLQTYRELTALISEASTSGWFSFRLQGDFRQLQAQARFLFSTEQSTPICKMVSSHLFALIPELSDFNSEPEKEEEELQLERRGMVIWWQFRQSPKAAKSGKVLEQENPWLSSVDWLTAHTSKLDDLTLPYLRLSH